MRKHLIATLLCIPLVILALTPPWTFKLDCTLNSLFWLYMVFISGFLSILFFNFKVNVFLKMFLLWCFIGCFVSKAPYLCFTMYWSLTICAYYYLGCRSIKDFSPVKKVVQALFLFLVLLIIMQNFGLDTLLNFNHKDTIILGTIGNKQILATYVCVLAPFLISNPLNWILLFIIVCITKSAGGILAILTGLGYYAWRKYRLGKYILICFVMIGIFTTWRLGKFDVFMTYGRFPVWKKTIELTLKHPQGYGVGCNKLLFPVLCGDILPTRGADEAVWEYDNTYGKGLAWRRTHNTFLQILFETGIPGFLFFMGWIGSIVWGARKDIIKSTGLVILLTIMFPHFPVRLTQAVLILLMYCAYCEYKGDNHGG